jgi:hypothetical protein
MNLYYTNLTNKCSKIIRSKNMDDAINIIANMKHDDNTKIGRKTAIQIYRRFGNYTVKYDMVKHANNIDQYNKEINANKLKALNLKN